LDHELRIIELAREPVRRPGWRPAWASRWWWRLSDQLRRSRPWRSTSAAATPPGRQRSQRETDRDRHL